MWQDKLEAALIMHQRSSFRQTRSRTTCGTRAQSPHPHQLHPCLHPFSCSPLSPSVWSVFCKESALAWDLALPTLFLFGAVGVCCFISPMYSVHLEPGDKILGKRPWLWWLHKIKDLKTNTDTDTQPGEVVKIKIVHCASIDLNLLCYCSYTFKAPCSRKMFTTLNGGHLPP